MASKKPTIQDARNKIQSLYGNDPSMRVNLASKRVWGGMEYTLVYSGSVNDRLRFDHIKEVLLFLDGIEKISAESRSA